MKTFRRTLFFILVSGLSVAGLGIMLQHPGYYGSVNASSLFPFLMIGSVFGSLLWSMAFLKTEPTMARIALGAVTVVLIVSLIVASSPSNTD